MTGCIIIVATVLHCFVGPLADAASAFGTCEGRKTERLLEIGRNDAREGSDAVNSAVS